MNTQGRNKAKKKTKQISREKRKERIVNETFPIFFGDFFFTFFLRSVSLCRRRFRSSRAVHASSSSFNSFHHRMQHGHSIFAVVSLAQSTRHAHAHAHTQSRWTRAVMLRRKESRKMHRMRFIISYIKIHKIFL